MWITGPPFNRIAPFVAAAGGVAALGGAAALDQLGTLVISIHMVQHLLLTLVAAPLIAWSRPGIFLRRHLPPLWRARIATSLPGRLLIRAWRSAQRPVVAASLLCGSFLVWHLPRPYAATVYDDGLRWLALLSFFLTALAFWAAVMNRAQIRRFGHAPAMALVLAAAVVGGLPGALMTFAPRLLYANIPDPLPVCGLTAIEDQRLAGLIMWIPMDAIFVAAAAWLFVAWFAEAERSASLHEALHRASRRAVAPVLVLGLAVVLAGCNDASDAETLAFGGNANHGAALITQFGCGTCHVIPGVAGAQGLVGPPLTTMARRVYIAGLLTNSPENMVTWLRDPQRIVPGNAMPQMNLSQDEARDIAAYLFTLR
jgi:putative membrane protein